MRPPRTGIPRRRTFLAQPRGARATRAAPRKKGNPVADYVIAEQIVAAFD